MQLSGVRLAWLFVCVLCWPALSGAGQGSVQDPGGGSVADPLRSELAAAAEKVLLPGRCGECHAAEYDVWKGTVHSTGFDTLHRSARSREISGNLGLRLIRRSSGEATPVCLGCHYTPTLRRGQLRAGAGVSCESCHGPARDWVSIHSSYGVATADPQLAPRLETARHRARRIAESTAAGMRRPSQIYELASACFGCHAVPNEELVNRGGHSTGSDFELVEWNGLIQHNFLESYKAGDGWTNAERPRDWKRIMYVVGRTLDVEYALRGIGSATEDGPYLAAARDRLGAALDDLLEIDDRVDAPEIRRIAAIAERAELALDDFAPLDVADAVRAATKAFIAESDGSTLAQLDPLWDEHLAETVMPARRTRDAATVRRDQAPIESDARPTARSSPPAAKRAGSETGGSPAAGREASTPDRSAASTRGAGAALAPHPPPVVTLSRPPWRNPPVHEFVRVPCGRCHSEQLEWWRRDPHSTAAAPLRNGDARALEIARAYGVVAEDMARGTQTCMWCHGTIVSRPSRRVRAGVGCQRCHGASADYLGPHETESHAESVGLGLTDLRDPRVQAATCAGCHYITDPGLINAGHPSGGDFEIVSRKADIVHWGAAVGRKSSSVEPTVLRAAHAAILAARGPVPLRVGPPPVIESTAERSRARGTLGDFAGTATAVEPGADATSPWHSAADDDAEADLPTASERTMLETAMDAIRRHLDELYRALGLLEEVN